MGQTRTSSLGAARPLPPSADIGPGGAVKALEDAQKILADYLEPGMPRNPEFTIERLMLTLDNDDLADA